jgi:uncharacterized membrane protein
MALEMTPVIAIHLSAAIAATAIGPVALWARLGRAQHPRLHRTFGYAWVTLMVVTAFSAIFIRSTTIININGYTPIHILIPVVFGLLVLAFWFLARGNINGHRKTMLRLYIGGCIVAGSFTLLPNRYLGNLIWGQWLGLLSADATGPSMLARILSGTPGWVWALLAGLLVLGYSQTRPRQTGLARALAMPLAMTTLSVYGTVSALGTSAAVLAGWLLSAVLAAAWVSRRPPAAGTRYDAARRVIEQPGSWAPLLLIVGIFLTKYIVIVSLTLHPALGLDPAFSLSVAMLYGCFSGLFAGRALRLVVDARRGPAIPLTPTAQA